jgi:hypothetical protein
MLGRLSEKKLDDSKPTTLKTIKCLFKPSTNIGDSLFKECSNDGLIQKVRLRLKTAFHMMSTVNITHFFGKTI